MKSKNWNRLRRLVRGWLAAILIVVPAVDAALASAAERPNILFLVVDDLKPLLGCYGDETVQTPNIDKLAARGVVFSNAHSNQAVCAASRCSFFTGLRPDRTGVHDLETDFLGVSPWAVSLPEYLREQGYATAGCGKLFHGGKSDGLMEERAWEIHTADEDLPYAEGFPPPVLFYQGEQQQQALESLQGQGGRLEYGKLKSMLKGQGLNPSTESLDLPDEAYGDGALREQALSYLDQLGKGDRPFFVAVGFRKPHLPFVAPKKYWDLYQRDALPLAAYREKPTDAPDFALHSWGELKNYADIDADSGPLSEDKQRELVHGYRACVSYVDAQIGLLLDGLEQRGLDGNTIVVLFGDHGWHLGDHGVWCKHTNYEQATRTPLIFAGPGIVAGTTTDSPTELIDVFPTLCQLTDTPLPKNLDGISLAPVVGEGADSSQEREVAVSSYPRHNGRFGYAFRDRRYRYVVWVKNDDLGTPLELLGKIVAEELYDYETDPEETANLAINDEQTERIEAFRTIARRHLRKQAGRIRRHAAANGL